MKSICFDEYFGYRGTPVTMVYPVKPNFSLLLQPYYSLENDAMEYFQEMPESISYGLLLEVLFERSIGDLPDAELSYFLELVQQLRDFKDRTETEAWWFRYYR